MTCVAPLFLDSPPGERLLGRLEVREEADGDDGNARRLLQERVVVVLDALDRQRAGLARPGEEEVVALVDPAALGIARVPARHADAVKRARGREAQLDQRIVVAEVRDLGVGAGEAAERRLGSRRKHSLVPPRELALGAEHGQLAPLDGQILRGDAALLRGPGDRVVAALEGVEDAHAADRAIQGVVRAGVVEEGQVLGEPEPRARLRKTEVVGVERAGGAPGARAPERETGGRMPQPEGGGQQLQGVRRGLDEARAEQAALPAGRRRPGGRRQRGRGPQQERQDQRRRPSHSSHGPPPAASPRPGPV